MRGRSKGKKNKNGGIKMQKKNIVHLERAQGTDSKLEFKLKNNFSSTAGCRMMQRA